MGDARRRFGTWSRRLVLGIGVTGVVASCGKSVRDGGGDDDRSSAGAGDSGGGSGNASGGRGGATVGRGGSVATGGRSGSTATGGFGGTTGGASTGGSGGDAGCGEPGAAGDPFAHCPSTAFGDQPLSSCTFEATCEALDCGALWSQFDETGCRRRECRAQADCSSGERCLPAVLAGQTGCYSSVYEECEWYCGECFCSASEDCATVAFCQPAADFPPENDCPVADIACEELWYFRDRVETDFEKGYADDVTFSFDACLDAIEERSAECQGGGGAPGL